MYRIDVPSAVAALPAPAAAGAPGYFSDGDPVGGQPATVLPADFVNMVMMELVNLVTASGAALSKTAYTQVRDAIGMVGSFGSSGYLKLPLGLILQWGVAAIPVSGSSTSSTPVTFPIAFPNALLSVAGNSDNSASGSWQWLGAQFQAATQTGMSVVADTANSSAVIAAGRNIRWIAIGR